MWLSRHDFNELKALTRVAQNKENDALRDSVYYKALYESDKLYTSKLEEQIKMLNQEKKELLDELLIASGVKMSKYQEALALKQMNDTDNTPAYNGQMRQWEHDMTSKSLKETESQKNQRAIELVEQLERESELNKVGGINYNDE